LFHSLLLWKDILFFCSTRAWTQGLHLEPLHQPYFCAGFFKIGSCRTICLGWLSTAILLIFASWIVRITGVSHLHRAVRIFFSPGDIVILKLLWDRYSHFWFILISDSMIYLFPSFKLKLICVIIYNMYFVQEAYSYISCHHIIWQLVDLIGAI
jgi:hypothetical protein